MYTLFLLGTLENILVHMTADTSVNTVKTALLSGTFTAEHNHNHHYPACTKEWHMETFIFHHVCN